MARLKPQEGFDALKDRVTETIRDIFPVEGKRQKLVLNEIEVQDQADVDDLRKQKEVKLKGGSWDVPVVADLSLVGPSGKEIHRKKTRIMSLPKTTGRYSYIVDGSEYQLDNQWVLKPGVYARRTDKGGLESQFNFRGGGFRMGFDPESAKFSVQRSASGAKIPLYPLLREMGMSDTQLEKQWGPDILKANRGGDQEKAVMDFHKALQGRPAENITEARQVFRRLANEADLDPDATKITLGKKLTGVTGETMSLAAGKLLGISRGEAKPDSRDALMFKKFRSAEDYLADEVADRRDEIRQKVANNLDRRRTVREVLPPHILNGAVSSVFKKSLAGTPDQANPLEMVSGQMRTTIMGEKGITSEHRISEEAKLVDPSHFGFLDPAHTPESSRAGVTLQLSMGAQKRGDKVVIPMYNMKTGRTEMVDPAKAHSSRVVLPDQIRWEKGKPVPLHKEVKISEEGNDVGKGRLEDAQYVLASPTQLYSAASNLIPFMQNTSGNRSTMAGRHMEQAIPLRDREEPLVQTVVSASQPRPVSYNKLLGEQSHQKARVGGEIVGVADDAITIKDEKGKKHEVQIYDNFPLNDNKAFIHSTPTVQVGDKVKKGQVVADTNYTKKGVLALGTNLTTAYMPLHGYNYEDGVVISESAAKKLSSEHLHRKGIDLTDDNVLNKRTFLTNSKTTLSTEQMEKLDDDGVIRVGQKVRPGDTLVAALRKRRKDDDESRMMSRMHRSLVRSFDDAAIRWEGDHEGEVTNVVHRPGKRAEVHVRTTEPAEIGDKIAGRHGNKGIVVSITPDAEMPRTKKGKVIDIAMNPLGIPGRTNLGQVYETAAAKIAEKTGKPYLVQNFDGTPDWNERLRKELKEHGLDDKEEVEIPVIDKKTGEIKGHQSVGQVTVGPHYVHKLKHQISRKLTARAGGAGYVYDVDHMPKGGGKPRQGAQSMDALGMYALLAHGATSNIRDMQTYKSNADVNDEVWNALQAGEPIPPPRPTFAYNKFMGYLKSLGVNVQKKGNSLQLLPLTDAQTLAMSNGELQDAGRKIMARTEEPEKRGLFDKQITGGMNGTKWSHITLPESMPNPVFEKGIAGVTGLQLKQFRGIMSGELGVDAKSGDVVPATDGTLKYGRAVKNLLERVDVADELKKAKQDLKKPGLKDNRLDQANRRVRFLQVLKDNNLSPVDAYMVKNVPVIPPSMRPLSIRPNGDINEDDLNGMYKGLALRAKKLREARPAMHDADKDPRRAAIYDALKSLSGLGGHLNREYRGILDIVRGKTVRKGEPKGGKPAEGFFQKKLIKRRQDLSMRGVIIPEPELGLDEVGIPRKAAMEVYKPFVVRELRQMTGMSPLAAQQAVEDEDIMAKKALERAVEKRPMLLKRDPVLHKYGVQSFNPVLTDGRAIKIHPMVTSGYNADFDGDQMNGYVPLTEEAVLEARKMHPSRNLFHPATGDVMYRPEKEAQLGLYMATRAGKNTKEAFKSQAEAAKAVASGKLGMTDMATIGGQRTTVGRLMVASALPKDLGKQVLTGGALDKAGQKQLLSAVAKEHRGDYAKVADKLKDMGNRYATTTGLTLGLEDLKPDKVTRDKHLRAADREAAKIKSMKLSPLERDKRLVGVYDKASQGIITDLEKKHEKNPTNLWHMKAAGLEPGEDVYRQIVAAPVLTMDAKGRVVPTPIKRSYSEGLDVGDYWTSMSGARKGVVQKVQSVRDPGVVSKEVNNALMSTLIEKTDCGTSRGITLPTGDTEVLDRFLAADTKAGRRTLKKGTLITPGVRDRLRNNRVDRVAVRSPLRCKHGEGLCSMCYGLDENGKLPEKGTNVGIISGQAIGERSTQLSMRIFHSGGVAPVGKKGQEKAALTDDFKRVQQLLRMYKTIPGSATLSRTSGQVGEITTDPAGGHNVFVGGRRHYVPHDRGVPMLGRKKQPLKRGMRVGRGDALSKGPINPHELLPLGGIDKVQRYLSSELHGLYKGEGIKRRNMEVVVRGITNRGQVEDPGEQRGLLRGDIVPLARTRSKNRELVRAGKKPASIAPVLRGINVMTPEAQSDWVARLNRTRLHDTVIDAANRGWVSNIHGPHPVPGIAYGAEFGKGDPY